MMSNERRIEIVARAVAQARNESLWQEWSKVSPYISDMRERFKLSYEEFRSYEPKVECSRLIYDSSKERSLQ